MAAAVCERSMTSNSAPRAGRQFGGPLCPLYAGAPAARPPVSASPLASADSGLGMDMPLDLDDPAFSDHCSLGDELSLQGSPTGSCYSEQGERSPHFYNGEDNFRPRRASFEQQHQQHQGAAQTPNERRGFLPKRGALGSSSPGRHDTLSGSGSPLFPSSPGASSSQLRPRTGSGPQVSQQSTLAPSPLNSGPMMSSRTTCSPQRTFMGLAPQQSYPPMGSNGNSGNSGKLPGLREQVLLRTSSGHSTEFESTSLDQDGADAVEDNSECLNYEDAESLCQEKELDKDQLEGVGIVPLPTTFAAPGTPEIVLYALYFSSSNLRPVLPGDDSIKLLFPKSLQDAADGGQKKVQRLGFGGKATSYKPKSSFGAYAAPQRKLAGTPIASFGTWKP